ncbi:hypothetical protein O3G_MSEX015514 [Manduca sexta]|uniref:Signal recognition particle SRP72 subunit RNA-binding domain-containing protein n=1 Tax=Manduca sexta TaxID=7130 RepID=A0A922CZX8_MANSE|nr:hypothetical protein O3G_MSEX015514 [Manduca sexta]
MSANKESNLVQAYIELNKFCQNGDYDRALKASGKILQIAPTEQKAFHCKVICHIQLHNFKEALTALTSSKNAALAADLHFEKAYTQYRLNMPKDALQTSKIDIDALESSKWMMGAKVVKKTVQSKQEQSPGTPGSELLQKKKQKRRRKTKLPPNADLSKPPDPERWLPKYERTAYRKRRGVRRDVIKGSQGMSTTATDQ